MKIEKVSYQKAYVIGPYLQEKVGFEASIDGDSPEEVLSKLRKMADEWHRANNPGSPASTATIPYDDKIPFTFTQTPVINREHERLKDLLADCTTLEELYKYADDVKKANNPDVTRMYEEIGIQLFKK